MVTRSTHSRQGAGCGEADMRLPYQATRNGALLKGLLDKHGLTLDGTLHEAGVPLPRMRLWRWTERTLPCTSDDIAPFVPLLAKYEGCGIDEVWQFIRDPRGRHAKLDALVGLRFWQPSTADMGELAALVGTRLLTSGRWIAAGCMIPPWLMDVGPRSRCLAALRRRAGLTGSDQADAWRSFHRAVHLQVMPRDQVLPLRGLVITPESTFLGCMRGDWPLSPSRPEHRAALASGMAWDAVLERGLIVGFIDDNPSRIAASIVNGINELECLLVADEKFLLRRRLGDPFWVTCERASNPVADRLLDEQVESLRHLERSIGHPLDAETSFGLLARHVIDVSAPHPAVEEAMRRLRLRPRRWQP